eukprot:3936551-Rhodomonas_salina.1
MLVTLRADSAVVPAVRMGFKAKWYLVPATGDDWSMRAPGVWDPSVNRETASARAPVATPVNHLFGLFKDLEKCSMSFVSVVDPYIGQFRARAFLDEVELRRNAGVLKGTVGVVRLQPHPLALARPLSASASD